MTCKVNEAKRIKLIKLIERQMGLFIATEEQRGLPKYVGMYILCIKRFV